MANADRRRPGADGGVAGAAFHCDAAAAAGTLCENAQRIAEFLATRARGGERAVSRAAGASGPRDRGEADAYFGPVLSFILRDKAAAETFFAKARLVTEATSFGGVSTLRNAARAGAAMRSPKALSA